MTCLGFNLVQQKKYADAEPVLRESLAIRDRNEPDLWTTFNTMSILGGSLLGQEKYADAEPLLLQGYEGMKLRSATIPPTVQNRLTEALERLVTLYEATGQQERAAQRRHELEAAKTKGKEGKN